MDHEEIFAADGDSSAVLYTGVGRLRGAHFVSSDSAGSLIFYDGSDSDGAEMATVKTAALAENGTFDVPGGGLSFGTALYVKITNITSMTAFYAKDRTYNPSS